MEERARKRKLEESDDDVEGVVKEQPMEGLKIKKQKTETPKKTNGSTVEDEEAKAARLERQKVKKAQKKEKLVKKQEKKKAKRDDAKAQVVSLEGDEKDLDIDVQGIEADQQEGQASEAPNEEVPLNEVEKIELNGLVDEDEEESHSTASPSSYNSPIFDQPTEPSANTSTSSIIPPATAPKHIKMPTDPELLKARLAARIEALRAARKADGPNGAPARNRQELMEARRKKEEERKAHKKELRKQARLDEEARREEALASARDSPASSLMSPALYTASNENFSFGRVAFGDGQQLNDSLNSLLSAPKKRGPQDPKSALEAAEKKRARIAGLDDEKRADIEEKELWLQARKRAHGEKVRDDTSLLKKTLKRKEKAKKKSEKEWTERKEGVSKSIAMKQKKREENIQKRKDEKGSKGKGKGKGKSAGKGKPKVKSRPGFEGRSFGGGKKK